MSAGTARSMKINRQLSTTKKKSGQTMDQYLREIKVAADSLALINSPVIDKDLIEYALLGLGPEFESILGGLAYVPPTFTFDKLGPILDLQERRLQYMCGTAVSSSGFCSHWTGFLQCSSPSAAALPWTRRYTNPWRSQWTWPALPSAGSSGPWQRVWLPWYSWTSAFSTWI
ncbi:unnamed protein product [Cuscuta europaea]|uniref:Uncharacterized protein n=1 Tax=Cuscuta europaea TaxID=41803 RepID=A0A9P0YZD4_CUSEU|nr:unnamed protein product [Cuscuta europaea]